MPDRPTLSATGHGSRPDSGDPTDRLSRAVSPPPGWVGAADRPTLSEAARARRVYFQLRLATSILMSKLSRSYNPFVSHSHSTSGSDTCGALARLSPSYLTRTGG